jgi:hypothetical protein
MKLDLATLARDARAAHEPIRRANGRVVVLLDEVDQYDHAVVSLFDELLDGFGLGTAEEPVPVVLTFSLGGTMDHFLRAVVVERGITRTWLDVRELTGFLEDGEDLMAYELVLLNPFNPGLLPGLSDRSWAFNPGAEEELRARWVSRFRRNLGGVPSALTDRVLYALVDAARDADFVVEADDEIRLARLQDDE